jgi:hypothetical protein
MLESADWESDDRGFTVCCVLLQKSKCPVYNTVQGNNSYIQTVMKCKTHTALEVGLLCQ